MGVFGWKVAPCTCYVPVTLQDFCRMQGASLSPKCKKGVAQALFALLDRPVPPLRAKSDSVPVRGLGQSHASAGQRHLQPQPAVLGGGCGGAEQVASLPTSLGSVGLRTLAVAQDK